MKEDIQGLLINQELFEELTGIQYDEIKHGITPLDAKNMTSEGIQKARKNFSFESALDKARLGKTQKITISKRFSDLIFHILFSIVVIAIFLQCFSWISSFIFKVNFLNYRVPILNMPLYRGSIPLGFWMGIEINKSSNIEFIEHGKMKVERLESLKRLRKLFGECENYNKIIKSIDVKDQIANILDPTRDEGRKEILLALEKIRINLIKALKIDKIIRENSDVVNTSRESLEITFAELQYIDVASHANQYSQFVDEILNLGVSLNREFKILRREQMEKGES